MFYKLMANKLINRVRDLLHFRGSEESNFHAMPTVTINDNLYLSQRTIVRSATSGTIYTTENDPSKEFYLQGFWISARCPVSVDPGTSELTATIDGVAQTLGRIEFVTTFAVAEGQGQQDSCAISFSVPLKIDKNTAITITQNSTSGKAYIYGFYEYVR